MITSRERPAIVRHMCGSHALIASKTTIIPPIILPNHPYSRDLPLLPVAFEPLAADLDINEDLDFLYFNSDGSLDREDLEDDFLESFLLPARVPQ